MFDESALPRLTFVQVAKDAGFSLGEIRKLIRDFKGQRWRTLEEKKLAEIDAAAARLRVMRTLLRGLLDECGCFDVEACGSAMKRLRLR